MPRDLDFLRRPTHRSHVDTTPNRITTPQKVIKKPTNWSMWLIVVVIFGTASAFLYLRHAQPIATLPIATGSPSTTPTTTVSSSQSVAPIVTVYTSGASQAAVTSFVASLNQVGFTAQNLGQSQFGLDQTYIWYQPAFQADAEKIGSLLGNKKVALRSYQGTGPYKILVQLGP